VARPVAGRLCAPRTREVLLNSPAITPISVAEASERTGLAIQTLRNWLVTGKIKKYRVGETRRIVLDAAEIDALVKPATRKTA
jgi:excisionase family DNA binding protein